LSACHPLLQANRVASVVDAMGRPGFTLGIGPSHELVIRGIYGMSYDHPGRSTEEYARIVAGLLVSVHDDKSEARSAAAARSAGCAGLANYRRILGIGGAATAADAAIVGDETSVRTQLQAVLDAGATGILADVVPAGPDQTASLRRTTGLLRDLLS
jgi:alkanesulfonate monooxygenase SsuD/methylene tetrahydromethanopterin reductase-like flavin-dependent oxidoreductase (luciferase family)